MSAKKQINHVEAARDAITGYVAIVLGIVCFILALVIITAIVRVVVGTGISSTANATAAQTTQTVTSFMQVSPSTAALPALGGMV